MNLTIQEHRTAHDGNMNTVLCSIMNSNGINLRTHGSSTAYYRLSDVMSKCPTTATVVAAVIGEGTERQQTAFPLVYEVDYVRVYQSNEDFNP